MRKPANVSQRLLVPALVLAMVVAVAGCGEKRPPRTNVERPALPVVIGAIVTPDQVRISPNSIGAGTVDVLVSNKSGKAQRITLELIDGTGGEDSIALETSPISAGENTRAQAALEPGTYELRAGDGIKPAVVHVGEERPSSQNELLTP